MRVWCVGESQELVITIKKNGDTKIESFETKVSFGKDSHLKMKLNCGNMKN